MDKTEDILISLQQKYVCKMLEGRKTVELRRRVLRVSSGTRVWIYSKSPHAVVEVLAVVDEVVSAPPKQLWQDYQDRLGVSESEFSAYFVDVKLGCAVILKNVQRLRSGVSLTELRRHSASFQPPQFFLRLQEGSPALRALEGTSTVEIRPIPSPLASC